MILVAGSTGLVGRSICRRLVDQGKAVRALVRPSADAAKVEGLQKLGVEIVHGDLRDRATLEAACYRATTVISTASALPVCYVAGVNDIRTVDEQGLANLIGAATSAGVERFVYTSFSGNIDLDFPLRNAKRVTEERVRVSGMTYTILRPSYFMEIWLSPIIGFDFANATAQVYGEGANPISYVSFEDVAQFAVASLNTPAAENTILEVGGPEALSPHEVIRIFERIGGRPFTVSYVPESALAQQQRDSADPMQQSFAGLMRCYARGDAIDMAATLQAFPMHLESVAEYAHSVMRLPAA